jgi:hypothetical protein
VICCWGRTHRWTCSRPIARSTVAGQLWGSCGRTSIVQFHPADAVQKAFSVAKIEHPEVMDENGRQKVGGLMDPKMGSMSHPHHSPHFMRCLLVPRSASRAHDRVSDRPKLQMPDLSRGHGRVSRSFRTH